MPCLDCLLVLIELFKGRLENLLFVAYFACPWRIWIIGPKTPGHNAVCCARTFLGLTAGIKTQTYHELKNDASLRVRVEGY